MTFWEKFKILSSNIIDFLLPFIKILLTQSGKILAEVALEVVTNCNDLDIQNDEKRQVAFQKIFEILSSKGIELGKSVINTAIEMAVLKLKSLSK